MVADLGVGSGVGVGVGTGVGTGVSDGLGLGWTLILELSPVPKGFTTSSTMIAMRISRMTARAPRPRGVIL